MTWCRISAVEIIVSPGPVPLSSPSISCTFIRTHQLALTLRAQDPSYLTFAVDVKLIFTCFAPLVSVEVELQPCGADARAAFNNGLGLAKFSSTVYWTIYYWHILTIYWLGVDALHSHICSSSAWLQVKGWQVSSERSRLFHSHQQAKLSMCTILSHSHCNSSPLGTEAPVIFHLGPRCWASWVDLTGLPPCKATAP